MAEYDFNINRPGQINGTGDVDAMFLKVFGGEVLMQFEKRTVTQGRHFVRTITSGKSAAFPNIGNATAEYHVPGTLLRGLKIDGAETIITVDDKLVSHVSIADVDQFKSHFDFRGPYTEALGRELADIYDQHVLQMGCLAAGASNVLNEADGGEEIFTNDARLSVASPNFATNVDSLVDALFVAAAALDEKNVPSEGRVAYVKPTTYYKLVQHDKVINRDFSAGNGDFARGMVYEVAGFEIVKTNNLPTEDLSLDTSVRAGTGNKYRGNFLDTAALLMTPQAVGTVMYHGIKTGTDGYEEKTQSQLWVAKYLLGHGLLRPQCAVRLVNRDLI